MLIKLEQSRFLRMDLTYPFLFRVVTTAPWKDPRAAREEEAQTTYRRICVCGVAAYRCRICSATDDGMERSHLQKHVQQKQSMLIQSPPFDIVVSFATDGVAVTHDMLVIKYPCTAATGGRDHDGIQVLL